MKKILCIAAAVLLLFTGCSMKGSQIKPLSQEISSQVRIRHKNIDYEVQLVRDSSQTKIIYKLPKSHGGLTLIKTSEGDCKAELLGLNVVSSDALFKENSAIYLIDRVLNIILSEQEEKYEQRIQDNKVILGGKFDSEQFEVVRYADKPQIISISVPTQELTVTFDIDKKATA